MIVNTTEKRNSFREIRMIGRLETTTEPDHTEVFIDHYDRLLKWAIYLCRGDVAAAEDLVQTAYIQFITRRPPLESIENPFAYLCRLTSNLRKNQLLRASTQKRGSGIGEMPLLEEMVAQEVENNDQARDILIEIAHFAVLQRQRSKTGSALILRFLLGYFPAEIAKLLRLSIFAVNNLIMRGRRDLRDFIKDPAKKSTVKR
jgi:RNA polymerase sigma factor (sigma-70 family)